MGKTEKEPRIRKFLSFNPQVESHRQAYEIFEKHGFSSDFVIECILKYENGVTREDLHQELQMLLQEGIIQPDVSAVMPDMPAGLDYQKKDKKNESDIKKIPQAMFDLMKQI